MSSPEIPEPLRGRIDDLARALESLGPPRPATAAEICEVLDFLVTAAKAEALDDAADHIDEAHIDDWLNPTRGAAVWLRQRATDMRKDADQ